MTVKSTMTDTELFLVTIPDAGKVRGMVRSLADAAATKERERIITFLRDHAYISTEVAVIHIRGFE